MSIFERWGFGKPGSAARTTAESDTVRKIVESLDHMPPDDAARLAAFAYVLGRVARADLDVSPDETREMERIVCEHGALSRDQAVIVVHMAKTHNLLFGGTENYLVTREFNRLASTAEKKHLLDCLFAVSAADSRVTGAEDQVIRQIADELLLEHRDFIEARSRYRSQLSVLDPGDG